MIILRIKKKSLGKVWAKWSTAFISSPLRWMIWVFLLIYFIWCVYQMAAEFQAIKGHHRLMFLIILISFLPIGNVYVGSRGMIVQMRFIPWKNLNIRASATTAKRRYLEIGWTSSFSSKIKRKLIPVPKRIPDLKWIEKKLDHKYETNFQ